MARGRSKNRHSSYMDMVNEIDCHGRSLKSWDINFISNIIDKPPERFTPAMITQIKRIYKETC